MSLKKTVKIFLLAGASVFSLILSGCSSDNNVAVINYRMVIENHPEMEKARQDMQNAYLEINNEYNSLASLPDTERNAKIADIQQRMREKEKEVIGPVRDNIEKNIDAVIAEKNITAVFDKSVAIRSGNDITADVMAKSGVPDDKIKDLLNENQVDDNQQAK